MASRTRNNCVSVNFTTAHYYAAWRSINDAQEPPRTEIVALSNAPGDGPIHDRWIIYGNQRLRVGTSFNTLGVKRSEISLLDEPEAARIGNELRRYCERERVVGGQRVAYLSLNM